MYVYRSTAGNFHQEKTFVNFATGHHWQKFLCTKLHHSVIFDKVIYMQ